MKIAKFLKQIIIIIITRQKNNTINTGKYTNIL